MPTRQRAWLIPARLPAGSRQFRCGADGGKLAGAARRSSGCAFRTRAGQRRDRAATAPATGDCWCRPQRLLALAGALMQALLRNPLADPTFLDGGAGVSDVCVIWGLPVLAWDSLGFVKRLAPCSSSASARRRAQGTQTWPRLHRQHRRRRLARAGGADAGDCDENRLRGMAFLADGRPWPEHAMVGLHCWRSASDCPWPCPLPANSTCSHAAPRAQAPGCCGRSAALGDLSAGLAGHRCLGHHGRLNRLRRAGGTASRSDSRLGNDQYLLLPASAGGGSPFVLAGHRRPYTIAPQQLLVGVHRFDRRPGVPPLPRQPRAHR